jgi:hypothetical protein
VASLSSPSDFGTFRSNSISHRRLSRYPAEHRADGHPESGHVALPQDVAGHDFACREDIRRRRAVLHDDLSSPVHGEAQVGKGDPRAQGVGIEWLGIQ